MRARQGRTLIEMLIAMAVLAIMAVAALPRVSINRYRIDGAARMVQTVLASAQQTAIQRGMPVLVFGDAAVTPNRLEVVVDSTGDGAFTTGERRSFRVLPEGARFMSPTATIDGASAAIATGAGVTLSSSTRFVVAFSASGGASGDVVIYLGTAAARDDERRAVQMAGSTARTRFWRRRSGSWRPDEL